MKHSDKIKLARKIITPLEIKLHTPLFDSAEWIKRKQSKLTKSARAYQSFIGKKGGDATKAKMPPNYYSELGKKGKAKQMELKNNGK